MLTYYESEGSPCLWYESEEQWQEEYAIQEETEVNEFNELCHFWYNKIEDSEINYDLAEKLCGELDELWPVQHSYQCRWDDVERIRLEYLTRLKY